MNKVIAIIEGVSRTTGWVGMTLVVPLIGALVYEVFSRYVLGTPTIWSFEMSYMLTGAIFLMSLAYALQARLHVHVDLISAVLPVWLKALVDLVGYGVFLVVMAWTSQALLEAAVESYRIGEVSGKSAWNPVIWPFKVIWFIGFLVFSLQVFAEMLRSLGLLLESDDVEAKA